MKNTLKTHFFTKTKADLPAKPSQALRILHTSDWHLGKMLYNQSRYDEFAKFLDWLQDALLVHQVDILIVAGDIFDTMTPSNRAEQLYHQFLAQAYKNQIKHIIIVAGNHDSPTNLQKTKEVLGALNTHVIGHASQNPEDECLCLYDQGKPMAIVLAVPYLRERDVRQSLGGESWQDKNEQVLAGVAKHYAHLSQLAQAQKDTLTKQHKTHLPIIATGHLFAAGASVSSSDDGMRDLQVGTLGQISSSIFDDNLDYVALGHIHAPQMVAKKNHIRYCGSPIAMGFGEMGKTKQVLVVDFQEDQPPQVHSLTVPVFQDLASIKGDMDFIKQSLEQLKTKNRSIWLEIEYIGEEILTNLKQEILAALQDSQLSALSIKNKRLYQGSLNNKQTGFHLNELDEMQVFLQRLGKEALSAQEIQDLSLAYQELLNQLHETDHQAE